MDGYKPSIFSKKFPKVLDFKLELWYTHYRKEREEATMKKIYFDLDGTLYNLYQYKNWLSCLRNEDPAPFQMGKGGALVDLKELQKIANEGLKKGIVFGVITWLPMFASEEFEEVCTKAKRKWVNKFLPFVTEFYAQSYGVPKQYAPSKRAKEMYLFDDNADVLSMWETEQQRIAVNVSKNNLLEELKKIVES